MSKLALKGHLKRGKEVIQLLEMLGGNNIHNYDGTFNECYAIDNNKICSIYTSVAKIDNCVIFTLEEFEKKFPYKVGDKVIDTIQNKSVEIYKMSWSENNNCIYYDVKRHDKVGYRRSYKFLRPYKESKCLDICFESTCLQELKEHLDNATPEQLEEDWKELEKFSEVGPIADEYIKQCKEFVKPYKEENIEEKGDEPKAPILSNRYDYAEGKCGYVIPDGYEFDSIKHGFQTEIIIRPIKPQYPKNYAECCEVLGIDEDLWFVYEDIDGNHINPACISNYRKRRLDLYHNFEKLSIRRDAYWKVYGEQMGLGKPWEPDWKDYSDKYFICYLKDELWMSNVRDCNRFLVFPTEETRDTFFENFKDLIEQCKELL